MLTNAMQKTSSDQNLTFLHHWLHKTWKVREAAGGVEILNAIFYRLRTGANGACCQPIFQPGVVWYYLHRTWRNDGTLEQISTHIRRDVRAQ